MATQSIKQRAADVAQTADEVRRLIRYRYDTFADAADDLEVSRGTLANIFSYTKRLEDVAALVDDISVKEE